MQADRVHALCVHALCVHAVCVHVVSAAQRPVEQQGQDERLPALKATLRVKSMSAGFG